MHRRTSREHPSRFLLCKSSGRMQRKNTKEYLISDIPGESREDSVHETGTASERFAPIGDNSHGEEAVTEEGAFSAMLHGECDRGSRGESAVIDRADSVIEVGHEAQNDDDGQEHRHCSPTESRQACLQQSYFRIRRDRHVVCSRAVPQNFPVAKTQATSFGNYSDKSFP